MKLIKKYRWPGNVAELQTMTLSAVLNFGGKEIDAPHLQMRMDGNWRPHTEEHLEELALEDIVERKLKQFMVRLERYDAENLHAAIMERVERPLIKLVMERSKNNQLKASRILGINRNTLRTKLKKLDIER
jgi:two-component system nitrogen regulation response regulator GlnG